jgi:hypothetical protein
MLNDAEKGTCGNITVWYHMEAYIEKLTGLLGGLATTCPIKSFFELKRTGTKNKLGYWFT